MNEVEVAGEMLLTLVGVVAPIVLITRFLAGTQAGPPADAAWPRGVQEEEPRRWNVELVDRRAARPGLPRKAGHSSRCPVPYPR